MLSFFRGLATLAKPKLKDIVIIGGGPAGLSILLSLKNNPSTSHLKCALIEAGSLDGVRNFGVDPPEHFTNRVVSLTPKSIEFMQLKAGNWEYIDAERVKFYDNMIAYDGTDLDARIEFDSSQTNSGIIAAMSEIFNIQSSLLQKLDALNEELPEEHKGHVMDNTKVTDISLLPGANTDSGVLDWPVVSLDNGESFQTRLLIGADGKNSPVRKFAGIESRGWAYGRFGVVATLKLQNEDWRAIAWQRFLPTGPLAILPLPEDNATLVWSSTPELADILLKTDKEIFPHLVNAAMCLEETDLNYIYGLLKENPNDQEAVEEIKWRMSRIPDEELEEKFPVPITEVIDSSRARFPLQMFHADTYTAPRVALVGDAAHTIHPLAGQGLNMGQSDVAELVDVIEKALSRGQDIGSPLLLDYYTANAWPQNHVMLGVCDKLHKVFSFNFGPFTTLRAFGIKSLNMLGGIKDVMISSVSGR